MYLRLVYMDKTLIRGDVTELRGLLAFQSRGYYCSVPFSGSCRYDLVADIDHYLLRIQCKSSVYHEDLGVLAMGAKRTTTNTKKTINYLYSKDEIDYFYTYHDNYDFLIPVTDVNTGIYLRLKPPKNYVQHQINAAADYLFDNVITSVKQRTPINHYSNNYIVSLDPATNIEQSWSQEELLAKYTQRQINYIKECAWKKKMGYGLLWKFKEFPTL